MLQKSCGANTTGCGFSTNFKSPNVASSSVQFCNMSPKEDKNNVLKMCLNEKQNEL